MSNTCKHEKLECANCNTVGCFAEPDFCSNGLLIIRVPAESDVVSEDGKLHQRTYARCRKCGKPEFWIISQ